MLEKTPLLSHCTIVKDCPWDESRGSFADGKVELEPAASLTIIKHLVISPWLCIPTYGKGIVDLQLNLISNITHAKSQCAQNLPMKVKTEKSPSFPYVTFKDKEFILLYPNNILGLGEGL